MALKVCFNNQIHRIAKIPTTYQALIQTVAFLFENQLPPRWTLQYVDSDGDSIMLSDENDFKNLVEEELEGSNKSIKIYIFPLQDLEKSQLNISIPNQTEEFQLIEKQKSMSEKSDTIEEPAQEEKPTIQEPEPVQETKDTIEQTPKEPQQVQEAQETPKPAETNETPDISQNQEEKPSQPEEETAKPKQEEEQPQGAFQPHHGRRCPRFRNRAKRIVKKLTRPNLSETKREKL